MLDNKTITILKSTVPILKESGRVLVDYFYKRMFAHNPEVLEIFNENNQNGTQQQALTNAILSYASNIENLVVLNNAIDLINNKHASLGIKPEHYPIVGKHIIASIKEVLKNDATDDTIDAWTKAYQLLAQIFIDKENNIYQSQKKIKGGWNGFKTFYIADKVKENNLITSFYLKPQDNVILPVYKAGQYITIRVKNNSHKSETTMRNYSLSDKANENCFRISIKKDQQSGYVSNLLHDKFNINDTIEIAPPCGNFFLDLEKLGNSNLTLIAGGVGVTPIMSMLLFALENLSINQQITFIYCNTYNNHAFKKTINDLSNKYSNLKVYYRYDKLIDNNISKIAENESIGYIDIDFINNVIPEILNNHYYFCGPKVFMINLYKILKNLNISKNNINFEFFGPREAIED
ncbi:MAG: NO-inducible flavohemoprotein [Anaplasmataceae bacterium]|nr:NO-inducible flavohemoprotein [Anaplasmataceae bacterium]